MLKFLIAHDYSKLFERCWNKSFQLNTLDDEAIIIISF